MTIENSIHLPSDDTSDIFLCCLAEQLSYIARSFALVPKELLWGWRGYDPSSDGYVKLVESRNGTLVFRRPGYNMSEIRISGLKLTGGGVRICQQVNENWRITDKQPVQKFKNPSDEPREITLSHTFDCLKTPAKAREIASWELTRQHVRIGLAKPEELGPKPDCSQRQVTETKTAVLAPWEKAKACLERSYQCDTVRIGTCGFPDFSIALGEWGNNIWRRIPTGEGNERKRYFECDSVHALLQTLIGKGDPKEHLSEWFFQHPVRNVTLLHYCQGRHIKWPDLQAEHRCEDDVSVDLAIKRKPLHR